MQIILQDESMFINKCEHVVCNITRIRRHAIKLRHFKRKEVLCMKKHFYRLRNPSATLKCVVSVTTSPDLPILYIRRTHTRTRTRTRIRTRTLNYKYSYDYVLNMQTVIIHMASKLIVVQPTNCNYGFLYNLK